MKKPAIQPNFEELLRVLRREKPSRPVLFELFMNPKVYGQLAEHAPADDSPLAYQRHVIDAFCAGGYDYASVHGSDFCFPINERQFQKTISLNDGFVITDEASFEAYPWQDPNACDYSLLEALGPYLPDGMKLMAMGPCGVLENAIALVGYENLCLMLHEEPDLAGRVFDKVGSGLLRYYEICAEFDSVGLLMSNDDWGFNTQTFLSPAHMRQYVFPWHKRIVEAGHARGKPVVLHSCGYMGDVFEDVIEDMGFDGKHSYEDAILPVEDSYARWGGRIGILGGIDLDFVMRSSIEEIRRRCDAMLDLAQERGGYALGSGNSIPEYIPYEKYRVMIDAALARR